MRRSLAAAAVLFVSPLAAQATWSQLYPAASPPPRHDALMARHDASGTVMLLFGANGSTTFNDAWAFTGTGASATWTQLAGPLPPPRQRTSLVYDSVRQRLVLFGGYNSPLAFDLDDTWEWNGATWLNRSPAVHPSARRYAAIAYDPVRHVTVVFGGWSGQTSTRLQDTWEWNGSTWQQRSLPASPPAREQGLLAFDPVRGSLVLHGGVGTVGGQPTALADTWSYDGTTWTQRFPATPPPFRLDANMVADTARQRVVLLGGFFGDPFTWEWDGSEWHVLYQPSPAPRFSFGMTYDPENQQILVHGGRVGAAGVWFAVGDTWAMRTPWPAAVTTYGAGCAGTAGTPSLGPWPYNLAWLGDTVRHTATALPFESAALFVSSFTQSPPISLAGLGMPGCDLLLPVDHIDFVVAAGGIADWTLPIPNQASLAGVPFFQQAFVIDPAANTLGLTSTNGLVVTPGIR